MWSLEKFKYKYTVHIQANKPYVAEVFHFHGLHLHNPYKYMDYYYYYSYWMYLFIRKCDVFYMNGFWLTSLLLFFYFSLINIVFREFSVSTLIGCSVYF